ncbi:MAG: metalloregulator ArsR/SmtB family transcription factor [Lentisphaerae bacterium]|nr:metalloregulator ArsR/SmtB family transcription factor [Lentisphaerota bacterium]
MGRADRQFKDQVYVQLGRLGKALGSPKRLELLDLLAQAPRTVEALAQAAGLNLANASKHLQALRAVRLVAARKNGLYVSYRVSSLTVTMFSRALRRLAEERLAEIADVTRRYLDGREGLEPVDGKELLKRVRSGTVTVLDVRPREEYLAGHIPGAVSIPLSQLGRRLRELPRGRTIVAYCRGPYCVLALKAIELLGKNGFQAIRLADGIPDWRAKRLPVAMGEK